MLAVRVDGDYHRIAIEGRKAGLQSRALAPVLLMPQHLSARQGRHLGGAVGAAVVHDDHPVCVLSGAQNHAADGDLLVIGGEQGGDGGH